MAAKSHSFSVGSAIPAEAQTDFRQTKKHWILFLKPLAKAGFFLALLNAWVLLFPSRFNFSIAAVLVFVVLLVTGFSLISTWFDTQFTRYAISPQSIQIRHGITKTSLNEFSFSNIESVEVFQTIAGRYFDYGTVRIKGNSGSVRKLTYVANPNMFMRH